MPRRFTKKILLVGSAFLALCPAHAGAVTVAPFFEEAISAASAWTGGADWDAGPLLTSDAYPGLDFLAPGPAGPGALSWEALNAAGALDYAALPDPDSGPERLTKFLALLLVVGAAVRYLTSKAWDDFISDVYYPRNY
jgi:hypothetical protein